jgi:hypothetical protein
VALGAAIVLAGCESTSAAKARPNRAPAAPLRIGAGATVAGVRVGERVKVTLLAFRPSIAGGADDHPEFNMQYAAAELRLTNVGSVSYTVAPADSIVVISNEGTKSKRAQLSEGACADAFAHEVDIAPGRSAEGCVPLQISVVAIPATLTFAPSPSDAGERVEWTLTKPRKTS